MAKRPRCQYCKKAFTPPRRGRPPAYCCDSHRQLAYQRRRARGDMPSLLLGRDIEDIRTKAGVERAVVDVLRRYGILPPAPKPAPRLKIVKDGDEGA